MQSTHKRITQRRALEVLSTEHYNDLLNNYNKVQVLVLGQSISAAEAHKQYQDGIIAFAKHITSPDIKKRFLKEIDSFMRSCALGVWNADGTTPSPMYVEYYNAIYTKPNLAPSILYWDLATQIKSAKGFIIPPFFDQMRDYDRTFGKSLARDFTDLYTLTALLFAAVDNEISEKEAAYVNSCADALLRLCKIDGIEGTKPNLKIEEFVTKPGTSASAENTQQANEVKEEKKEESQQEAEAVPQESLEELMAQLDDLCGLDKVKQDVKSLINLVKVRKLRQENDLPVPPMSLHLVFMGNPGTGKTTVARLLAKIYHAIGVLSKGQLVEVDRSGLVAGFVGQTAIKTSEVIQKALGGVLFIDEAYALADQDNPNDFGKEAIEVILKGMEDHRDDLIVIVAGYTNLMNRFIHSNPGLESRFNKYMFFDDYTGEQLMEIFRSQCRRNSYTLSKEAEEWAIAGFKKLYETRDENFGNGRDVRNIFEKAISHQADRIAAMEAPTKEQLMELTLEDLQETEEDQANREKATADYSKMEALNAQISDLEKSLSEHLNEEENKTGE